MQKRYTVVPLIIGLVIYATLHIPNKIEPIPKLPEVATEFGIYELDDRRSIEIRAEGGEVVYYEVTLDKAPDHGLSKGFYVMSEVDSVKLSTGWSISLNDSGTIVIQTGGGEIIERKFGQLDIESEPEVVREEVTRKAMVEEFDKLILSDSLAPKDKNN